MFHRRDGPRLVSAIAAPNPPRPRVTAGALFFQLAALPLASMQCTADPTSTIMIGVTMVKASDPGNITTSNASQKSAIGDVMPITKTHFGIWTRSAALRRDLIAWPPLAGPAPPQSK
jgi:hypothetical protein